MNTTSIVPKLSEAWELGFQAVFGLLIVMSVSVVAYYALAKLRGLNSQDSEHADLLQKNFEEMRSEGDISEAEFRKIRASLETPIGNRQLSKVADQQPSGTTSKE